MTVEAAASKHRRKDALPLHSDLVVMLRQWLKGLEPGQKLFPSSNANRRGSWSRSTWSASGIPYETEEGIADFHAAGRHSHVTALLGAERRCPRPKSWLGIQTSI